MAVSVMPQNPSLTLSMEKLLDQAQASGELKLCSRNLKQFPKHCCKYHLKDTVITDLSRNRLSELPEECTTFNSMEKFLLYHNMIKSIPESIVALQSLQFLDLSRNQLSYLPASICQLPLQGLIVNNNRLVSLPEEIGKMQTLMELDASCNEITHLPVQIGDLSSLKSLNLRRNHLQEVPVEISYLQLVTLDLSANRITNLPVELRFMTTVVHLNLGENPLTCPPANLCSRGRVHIFKYLEIQAIKEDRKRGVLTDSEYRRSYRKTGQLNDLRFTNGFGADARRKRHTADSGYGSEQPLDRRWSQEFTQEVIDMHTEDARRIVLRTANCPPSSSQPRLSRAGPVGGIGTTTVNGANRNQPLTSTGSNSSTSSSGYSSLNGCSSDYAAPSSASSSSSSSSSSASTTNGTVNYPVSRELRVAPPSLSSGSSSSCSPGAFNSNINSLEDEFTKIMDGMFQEKPVHVNGSTTTTTTTTTSTTTKEPVDKVDGGERNTSPDDQEKEETRRAAQKVLGKQGQYKEQLRQQRHSESNYQRNGSDLIHHHHADQMKNRLQAATAAAAAIASKTGVRYFPSASNNSTSTSTSTTTTATPPSSSSSSSYASPYDVKTMQKEAVLSYVKSKSSPSRANGEYGVGGGGGGPPPPLHCNGTNKGSSNSSSSSPYGSGGNNSSIPTPSTASIRSKMMMQQKIPPPPLPVQSNNDTRTFTARRDAEKSATADAHINQLRMHIEGRLRITLPEDLAPSLVDGVILCHMANHVKPRSVPSIHVPSPAVPKLTTAKCRRNVENFLLACRKLGVREDLICSPADILEPRKVGTVRVAISVSELLRNYQQHNNHLNHHLNHHHHHHPPPTTTTKQLA